MVISSTGQTNLPNTTPTTTLYEKPEKDKRTPQQACIEEGGFWDAKTQTCLRAPPTPTPTPQPTEPTKESKGQGEYFIPHVPNPVSREEYNAYKSSVGFQTAEKGAQTPLVEQTLSQTKGTRQFAEAQAMQEQDLLSQPQPMFTPDGRQIIQPQGLVSQGATLASAGAGAVVGAKAGAGLGTLIAPGVGTLIGGVVGAIGGAIGGAFIKQKVQKIQDVKEANKVFSQAKTNRAEILNMINSGIISEGQARTLWAEEKQNIYATQSFLKKQTQDDLNNFLGNPGDELIAVNSYLFLERYYDLEFEKALLQPNPSRIVQIPKEND